MPIGLFRELRVAMDDKKKPGLPYSRQPRVTVILKYMQKKPTSIRKQDDFIGILGTAGDRWYYHPLGFALVFVPLPSYRSRSLRFLLQDAPWSDSGPTPALRCDRCCRLVCQEMNRCCMASIKTARTSGEQGEDQIRSCTGHRQSDEGRSRAGHAGRNEGDRARC